MDKSIEICGMIAHIEQRVRKKTDYEEMEQNIGFSIAYIREYFKKHMGESLAHYITKRKISYAAFDLVHTNDSVLDISLSYAFGGPDTFTKAFRRYTGMTPKEFRKLKVPVGRGQLCTGISGIEIRKEHIFMEREKITDQGGTVLYGVPKAGYGVYDSCTPLAICMKAIINYSGERTEIMDILVRSGAAFRFAWNTEGWDGGNVDVMLTYEEPEEVYRRAGAAGGLACEAVSREKGADKEAFKRVIREQIDQGYPCLAMGIIGPPEVCLITGYRENGDVLLGWNFFQEAGEFASALEFDPCGYFICRDWWENPSTMMVFRMLPEQEAAIDDNKVIAEAAGVLEPHMYGPYAHGLQAYDAWKSALQQDEMFSEQNTLARMAEALMCQGDAMDCLAEGRYCAKLYFEKMADGQSEKAEALKKIAGAFGRVYESVTSMAEILGGWQRDETVMRNFMKKEVRRRLCDMIEAAKAADTEALELMKDYTG